MVRVGNTVRVAQMERGEKLAHAERTAHAVNTVTVASTVCVAPGALVALKARSGAVEKLVKRGAPGRRAALVSRMKSACLKWSRRSSTMCISSWASKCDDSGNSYNMSMNSPEWSVASQL